MKKWLEGYHSWWLRTTSKVNKVFRSSPLSLSFLVLKKLFDAHFVLLGIWGIFATPKTDIDCWIYAFKRAKVGNRKWDHLTLKEKFTTSKILILLAIRKEEKKSKIKFIDKGKYSPCWSCDSKGTLPNGKICSACKGKRIWKEDNYILVCEDAKGQKLSFMVDGLK